MFEFDKFDDCGDCNGTAVVAELGASVAVGEANAGVSAKIKKNQFSANPTFVNKKRFYLPDVTLVVIPVGVVANGTG